MDVTTCDDRQAWNHFLQEQSGPIFDSWEWGDACQTYGHQKKYLLVQQGNEMLGLLPLMHINSAVFGDMLISMPFSEYGSLVVDQSADKVEQIRSLLLEEARRIAHDLKVDYLCLRGTRYPASSEYLRFSRYLTFQIDLEREVKTLWDSFETRFRTDVRNAQSAGLTIRRVRRPDAEGEMNPVNIYYDLHLQTMRHHGTPPHSKSYFKRLWSTLGSHGNMQFLFVFNEGRPINGILIFPFSGTIHYWGAVSDGTYRQLGGGSLLLWDAIRWGCKHGYSTFDLGRTRKGTGVYRFKKSLGGTELYLDDLYYFPDGFVAPPDPEDPQFVPLIRIWQRFPLKMTELVGPHIRGGIP